MGGAEKKSCLYRSVSRRFINGLILLVPLVITFFVVEETLQFTEGVLGRHLPFYFPGLGIITMLIGIYLVGWLSSYWIMRRLIHFGEAALGKIPVVKFIYNSVKHLSTAVFESNNMFDHVVLVRTSPDLGEDLAGTHDFVNRLGHWWVLSFS